MPLIRAAGVLARRAPRPYVPLREVNQWTIGRRSGPVPAPGGARLPRGGAHLAGGARSARAAAARRAGDARLRPGLAARPVRGRLGGDQLAGGVRRPRPVAPPADDL